MPSWTIVFLPALILLTLIATLSIGVLLSALTVFYRDFRHIVPFLTQILMFVTPVIYPGELDPADVQLDHVAQPDVRHRHRIPFGHPRPPLGFRTCLAISAA